MKLKLLDALKFLVGWPISIVSIIFLLKFFPSSVSSLSKLEKINVPVILLSIFFFQLYFILRGLVWQKILEYKKHRVPFRKTLFLWGFSELKRYAPGNIWSFIGRTVLFNKEKVKTRDILKSILIESQIIIVSGFLVSLLSLGFLFNILPHHFKYEIFAQPAIFLFIIILTVLFIFNKKFINTTLLPSFKPIQNCILILFSSFALTCFGVGTYFAAASLFFLDPYNFFAFTGFFVFALLVGYLSIITPMGLGVREGIISAVLSKIMPLSQAIFISFFVRIIFIISEIVFLILSWIFYQTKNKFVIQTSSFISNHKQESLLFFFILSYFIYFTAASFLRYDAFFTGRFDLGNMDQTVWNTIHGRIFELTNPNGTDIISRLAFHADFLLVLISPLYWIWNNPKMLLLLQTTVVSMGALFVYLISKNILRDKNISLILSLVFLLNPALEHSNLYDFHPVVLATTFLLAAFYYLKTKRYILMAVFLTLSGISKEDVWIITSLFGLYLVILEKKKVLGSVIFFSSLIIFYFLFFIAIPKASGGQHFALSYYSEFGDSPVTIIKNIFTSPVKILKTALGKNQLIYLAQLFQPLGFLPLLAPIFLIFTLPSLLIDLLSNNSQLHTIYYQYSSSITPFLFIGTIYAISCLRRRIPKISLTLYSIFILLSTLISAYSFGPIIGSRNPNISMFTEDFSNDNLIDRFLQRIPKRYSVSASNEIGSHISHRQRVYTIPIGIDKADVVVMLLRSSLGEIPIKVIKDTENKLINDKNYFVVYRDSEFIVFKKEGLRRSFYYF